MDMNGEAENDVNEAEGGLERRSAYELLICCVCLRLREDWISLLC